MVAETPSKVELHMESRTPNATTTFAPFTKPGSPTTKRTTTTIDSTTPAIPLLSMPTASTGLSPRTTTTGNGSTTPGRGRSFSSLLVLGKGSFGTVKLTRVDGKQIAVKVIHKRTQSQNGGSGSNGYESEAESKARELRLQFGRQEAKLLSLLSHENIVRLHKFEEDDEQIRLFLEFVPGLSLQEALDRRMDSRMKEDEARPVFQQLLAAMTHAHSKNICHLDLKPENIIFHPILGTVKVIDFGLGTLLENESEPWSMGTSRGTLAYTAPEVLRESRCSKASDVWSLGVVLYRMLLGHLPFSGQTQWELRDNIVDPAMEPYITSRLTEECQELLRWMLKKNPTERPSMEEVLRHPWFQSHLSKLATASAGWENPSPRTITRTTPEPIPINNCRKAFPQISSCPARFMSFSEVPREEDEEEEEEEEEELERHKARGCVSADTILIEA